MGPQLYRCGNGKSIRGIAPPDFASMGPQLYRCGNAKVPLTLPTASFLLQWGRNFIVAEISRRARRRCSRMRCFNGAATLSLRKSVRAAFSRDKSQFASMGPQLYRCGNKETPGQARFNNYGFNGAATLSLRKSLTPASSATPSAVLQWGRNFIVAEINRNISITTIPIQ